MSVLVICPSRGRPDNALLLHASFMATKARASTKLLFVVDEDDPMRESYLDGVNCIVVEPSGRRGMTDPVNTAVAAALDEGWDVIGFVGDDHRFRTTGWDALFEDQLRAAGGGMAYANDRNWPNGEIPTQIFGSAKIWAALGWMCLPTARHLYLDNTWRVIGESVGRLFYYPSVVIEHMHPAYGKADWDDQYKALNSETTYSEDRVAFESWLQSGAEEDIARVRRALAA